MPQACKVCSSEHKAEIEATMAVGATLATISTLFGVTEASAGRHKRDHLARTEVKPSGEHLEAADRMIEQARATREFDSYDEGEALYLRTIATASTRRTIIPAYCTNSGSPLRRSGPRSRNRRRRMRSSSSQSSLRRSAVRHPTLGSGHSTPPLLPACHPTKPATSRPPPPIPVGIRTRRKRRRNGTSARQSVTPTSLNTAEPVASKERCNPCHFSTPNPSNTSIPLCSQPPTAAPAPRAASRFTCAVGNAGPQTMRL